MAENGVAQEVPPEAGATVTNPHLSLRHWSNVVALVVKSKGPYYRTMSAIF